MSNELVPKEVYDFMVPTNYENALEISKSFAKSMMIPKHFRNNPTDVLIAISYGNQLGLAPIMALNGIAVINGAPSLYGNVFWAVILSSPNYIKHQEFWDDDKKEWTTKIWKRGNEEPYTASFSFAEAEQAKLLKDPSKASTWGKYPKDMCMWRARGRAGKSGFSDALCGLSASQEVIDIEINDIPKPEMPNFDPETFSGSKTETTDTPSPKPPAKEEKKASEQKPEKQKEKKERASRTQKEEKVGKGVANTKTAKESEKESPDTIRDRVIHWMSKNPALHDELKKKLSIIFPECQNIDGYFNLKYLSVKDWISDGDIKIIDDTIQAGLYK